MLAQQGGCASKAGGERLVLPAAAGNPQKAGYARQKSGEERPRVAAYSHQRESKAKAACDSA